VLLNGVTRCRFSLLRAEDGVRRAMPLKYQSGVEVMKGDQVLCHGEPGETEFVVDGFVGDP
jgi:hypothetical protein